MNPTSTALMLALLSEQTTPSVVEELSDALMYVGYCLPTTTSEDDPTWLIRRIKKTALEEGGTLQTIMYPNGERRYNQSWSDRASLSYKVSSDADPDTLNITQEESS
ncbi:MAG: hypothetical protein Q4C30_09490 [Bacteroidia bacterium]|nr:hypothetical protein [Bacteroidia bacterium]